MLAVGIVGWGCYIPMYRIKTSEIARVWGEDPKKYEKGLFILEKSVPGPDEDVATMSVEAALNAIKRAGINPKKLGCVYVGTESKPYAVKPTGTVVAEAIGAGPGISAADYEFACKAGTEAVRACMALVRSGAIDYGLAIGADTAQGAPMDALEYSAAAGAAAFIIGRENLVASINGFYSYVTDTPDFWRKPGEKYPKHAEAFTGEPAYFKHVVNAAKNLMEEMGTTPDDYDYVVFHQPNGKFPLRAAKILGFPREKVEPGLLSPYIGNTYAASSLLGLAAVLDVAKPGQRILVVSYGSGAGSDAIDLTVTDKIQEKVDLAPKVKNYLDRRRLIDYALYARFRRKVEVPV